jgi:TolB-like protein
MLQRSIARSTAQILLVLLLSLTLAYAASPQSLIPSGSRIFVTPMDRNLDAFIIAEIQKQDVPVKVVLKQEDAQYVLTGFSQATGSNWADEVAGTIFGGKDKYEASIKMVSADGKTLVWAGEAGDRSLVFGAFHRGGQRKVAERIVKEMRSAIE